MAQFRRPDIKVFVDGADFETIRTGLSLPVTQGFTTNPSLVSQAGVADYTSYAKEVLALVPQLPVSFEVFNDTPQGMEREAHIIHAWGSNVYVKVPVITPAGESMGPLIRKLSAQGIALNVTCVFTVEQAQIVADALDPATPALVSVFAGRIADVGVDPVPIVEACRDIFKGHPRAELLWASTREVYNIWQAEQAGCRVITAPLSMVKKYNAIVKAGGKDLTELSCDGVQAFMNDIAQAGVKFGA